MASRDRLRLALALAMAMAMAGCHGSNGPPSSTAPDAAVEVVQAVVDAVPRGATVTRTDGQVLEIALLDLLNGPKLAFGPENGRTIVLHPRTPEGTGFLSAEQIDGDCRKHTVPPDLKAEILRRNTSVPQKYESVDASYAGISHDPRIVIADAHPKEADTDDPFVNPSDELFAARHPDAKAWVEAYLPAFSADGKTALVRAFVGPAAHAATATYLLELGNGRWTVQWKELAFYM
jgi:hypothetical protein